MAPRSVEAGGQAEEANPPAAAAEGGFLETAELADSRGSKPVPVPALRLMPKGSARNSKLLILIEGQIVQVS